MAVATMSYIYIPKSSICVCKNQRVTVFFQVVFLVIPDKPPDRHWPFQWRGYLYFSGARSNYLPCCGAIKAFFV